MYSAVMHNNSISCTPLDTKT